VSVCKLNAFFAGFLSALFLVPSAHFIYTIRPALTADVWIVNNCLVVRHFDILHFVVDPELCLIYYAITHIPPHDFYNEYRNRLSCGQLTGILAESFVSCIDKFQ
jgi:hypothetical protein